MQVELHPRETVGFPIEIDYCFLPILMETTNLGHLQRMNLFGIF